MIKKLFLILFSVSYLFSFQSSIEERLYSLNRDLMCPVCDGLTLEQSQAGPALEMKEEIKKMVIQGMSDKEIKDHFVNKFGIEILANPPKKGFDTLVWLAPLVFGFFRNNFTLQIFFFLNSIVISINIFLKLGANHNK